MLLLEQYNITLLSQSVCLTCLAFKSHTDDYLLLSVVVNVMFPFMTFNNFKTMIHQAIFN